MIVAGYPGIGKSTLAHLSKYRIIDLESSDFVVNGNRIDNWYEIYGKIAARLAAQGYIVFVSCHKLLRNYLKENCVEYFVIHPSLSLKSKWIKKLEDRYNYGEDPKNKRALEYVKKFYDDDINEIINNEVNRLEIHNINYNLENYISNNIIELS